MSPCAETQLSRVRQHPPFYPAPFSSRSVDNSDVNGELRTPFTVDNGNILLDDRAHVFRELVRRRRRSHQRDRRFIGLIHFTLRENAMNGMPARSIPPTLHTTPYPPNTSQ